MFFFFPIVYEAMYNADGWLDECGMENKSDGTRLWDSIINT